MNRDQLEDELGTARELCGDLKKKLNHMEQALEKVCFFPPLFFPSLLFLFFLRCWSRRINLVPCSIGNVFHLVPMSKRQTETEVGIFPALPHVGVTCGCWGLPSNRLFFNWNNRSSCLFFHWWPEMLRQSQKQQHQKYHESQYCSRITIRSRSVCLSFF